MMVIVNKDAREALKAAKENPKMKLTTWRKNNAKKSK